MLVAVRKAHHNNLDSIEAQMQRLRYSAEDRQINFLLTSRNSETNETVARNLYGWGRIGERV